MDKGLVSWIQGELLLSIVFSGGDILISSLEGDYYFPITLIELIGITLLFVMQKIVGKKKYSIRLINRLCIASSVLYSINTYAMVFRKLLIAEKPLWMALILFIPVIFIIFLVYFLETKSSKERKVVKVTETGAVGGCVALLYLLTRNQIKELDKVQFAITIMFLGYVLYLIMIFLQVLISLSLKVKEDDDSVTS